MVCIGMYLNRMILYVKALRKRITNIDFNLVEADCRALYRFRFLLFIILRFSSIRQLPFFFIFGGIKNIDSFEALSFPFYYYCTCLVFSVSSKVMDAGRMCSTCHTE